MTSKFKELDEAMNAIKEEILGDLFLSVSSKIQANEKSEFDHDLVQNSL